MAGASSPLEAHRLESQALEFMFHSSDWREGVGAFMERRAPGWTMRVPKDLPSWYPWSNDASEERA
jgi:pyrroloquinoline quinone (PQQ) biosynthesis protein C